MDIKRRGLAAAALWTAAVTTATAAEVALPLDLPAPAAVTITLEKSKEALRDGQPAQSAASKLVYDARIEPRDEGYQVVWKLKEARDASSGQDVTATVPNEPLIFLADETLAPVRLENWDAVREATLRFVEAQGGAPARAAMTATYEGLGPEAAAQAFLQDAALLSVGQGANLVPGEVVEYQDQVGNPLGGPPITTNASYALESVDRDQGKAVVVWKSAMDPASTAESLRQAVPGLLARMGAPVEGDSSRLMADMTVERTDQCRFGIDMKTGLAATAECERRTVVGMPGQGKQTRVERLKATQTLVR